MRISYNKLWKMLINKEMNKNDLKKTAVISPVSIAKLGKGANITFLKSVKLWIVR